MFKERRREKGMKNIYRILSKVCFTGCMSVFFIIAFRQLYLLYTSGREAMNSFVR